MAGRHQVVTLTGSAQNLATALTLTAPNTHCSSFSLQALGGNVGIVYVGGAGDTLTAATAYGFRIEIPVSTVPSAPWFRESRSVIGYLDLSDWQCIGTNGDKLAVQWDTCP